MSVTSSQSIPDLVRAAIDTIDKKATVILFGSRARGDFRKDSDWDFLILTDRKVTLELEDDILDKLYEVELKAGEVITSVIENRERWKNLELTPLFKNVKREGVVIESPQMV